MHVRARVLEFKTHEIASRHRINSCPEICLHVFKIRFSLSQKHSLTKYPVFLPIIISLSLQIYCYLKPYFVFHRAVRTHSLPCEFCDDSLQRHMTISSPNFTINPDSTKQQVLLSASRVCLRSISNNRRFLWNYLSFLELIVIFFKSFFLFFFVFVTVNQNKERKLWPVDVLPSRYR